MQSRRGPILAGLTALVSMVSACSRDASPPPEATATASALTIHQSVSAVADGYISSSTANKAFGTDPFLRVKSSGNNRALVAFSATDLSNAIGSGTVISATLELTISGTPASWGSGAPVGAYPVSQSWSETNATWSCAADANTSNSTPDCSGADVWVPSGNVPVPSGPASDSIVMTNGQSGTVSFDVTADVVAGVVGWLVAKTDGASGTAEFGSRESGVGPRLLLEIETGPCVADAQCSDGNTCNGQEVCSAGACAPGSALVCDDGEPKNGVESCDPVAGCVAGVPPPVLIAADTEIKSGSATKNFGTLSTVEVRAAATRTLLALEPAALAAAIGNGTVNGAHLELAISGSPGSWGTTGRPIGIYPVTQSFGETSATWSCSNDTNPANTTNDCAPGDGWSGNGNVPNPVTAPTDTVLITNGLSGTVSFDVTAAIAAGVSGFNLATTTGESGTVLFASRESGNGPRVLLDLSFECVRDADCDDADGCNGVETCADNLCVPAPPESYDADGDGTADCDDGCPVDSSKTQPGACGCGVVDTDGDGDETADCNDGCPSDPAKVAAGACGCAVSDVDTDGDATADCNDGCPNDLAKVAAGICGCGISDVDTDGDATVDCNDGCPADPAKVAAGACGCGLSDVDTDGDGTADCNDGCPSDPAKVAAGACGCGVADTDGDGDGTPNCNDGCPSDAAKVSAGVCGCGVSDADGDGDGTLDCVDSCPADPACSTFPAAGALVAHAEFRDFDANGSFETTSVGPYPIAGVEWYDGDLRVRRAAFEFDLSDLPAGAQVTSAELSVIPIGASYPPEGWQLEVWGYDANGVIESADAYRTEELLHDALIGPGFFFSADVSSFVAGAEAGDHVGLLLRAADEEYAGGTLTLSSLDDRVVLNVEYFVDCGADADSDGDGVCDASDTCAAGPDDVDQDGDGTPDACDGCPSHAAKSAPGQCGCAVADTDTDGDGIANCNDGCPADAAKTTPGVCGCGLADADGDGDGTLNCQDGCPADAAKTAPGQCGCGAPETDSDADGSADCVDLCPGSDDRIDVNDNGIPDGCEECLVDGDCTDGNVCTGVEHCVSGTCVAGTPLDCNDQQECSADTCHPVSGCGHTALGQAPITLVNGDFETGALAPWNTFQLTQSRVTAAVVQGKSAGHLPASNAVRFYVGKDPANASSLGGGGITQTVTTRSGYLTVTLYASASCAGNISIGGNVRLTIDDMEYVFHNFDSLEAGVTEYAALTHTKLVNAGTHTIKAEVTRSAGYTELVAIHLDDLKVKGSAVDGNLSYGCNGAAGFCVAGSCKACLQNADCDDANSCTQDSCQGTTSCQHAALPGASCGAGGQCAADATCSAPTITVDAPLLVGDTAVNGYQSTWGRYAQTSTFYVSVFRKGSTSQWQRRRTVLEFDAAQAASAADVVSARLVVTPSSEGDVNMLVCGYAGNGTYDLQTDPTTCTFVSGQATASGTWPTVIDVTAAVQSVLSQGGSIVGFNLQSTREQDQGGALGFQEAVLFYGSSVPNRPYLVLELAAPAP